ncbi:MAG: 1,4-dihydroxy-2-naphthoate polyprenyltransferase [Gammaproteobacteria bacterium]|nr:1,4-dihydroxy-2-naphthoate polyprenyltransferase [Gammaproteobacteria bacterium]
MNHLQHGFLAIRPKTLGISVAPVITGSALALADGSPLQWLTATAVLIAAILIQIGTNLYNDAADFERGADTPERLGPERATAQGWFSAAEVKRAALISFATAFTVGIYLVWVGGWPIVLIGLFSLAAGYAYTGGPKPIAYSASGELFVFIFFGLAAVMGSYYLQTLQLSWNALWVAVSVGSLAAAVLLVNNYRDLETDRKATKLTLTNYLGRQHSQWLYIALLILPFLLPISLGGYTGLILLALPMALWLIKRLATEQPGPAFNQILARTAQLQLIYSGLLTIGLIL